MKHRTLLTLISLLALTSTMSGCSWYMRQADAIGSAMPTYDDWFGEEKHADIPPVDPYQYGTAPQQGQLPPQAQPHGGMMPPPVGDLPPPGPGETPPPPPGYGGPDPAEGLKRLQMQQQQGGDQQPYVPFTEPEYENPAPAPQMDDMSATVTQEEPAAAPESNGGTFGFMGDVSDTVESWFTSDKSPKQPYPNLATVPATPAYGAAIDEMKQTQEELKQDHEQAQKQQKAVADWSDLVDDSSKPAEPAVAHIPEQAPAPQEENKEEMQIAIPASEAPMPETVVVMPTPKTDVEQPAPAPAPAPVVEQQIAAPIVEAPAPAVETKAEYLRAPRAETPAVPLLPTNRYLGRH